MSVLINIAAFAVAVGVLVTIHEFGHFWVARRLGVRVLRFSVGFGKPLLAWRKRPESTEYVLSALPLGGYVKMLDEREGEVAASERHLAFNRKPLSIRMAVVAAGPVFNLIFAVLAYWILFVAGSTVLKPVIGKVAPDSVAAAAGLRSGDEIVAVGGNGTPGWESVLMGLLDAAVDRGPVTLRVLTSDGTTVRRTMDLSGIKDVGAQKDLLKTVGIRPWQPVIPAVIGKIMPGTAASTADLRAGDRIVQGDGKTITDWSALADFTKTHPGQRVTLTILRDGTRHQIHVELGTRSAGKRAEGVLGVEPKVPKGLFKGMTRHVRYGPLAAVRHAARSTWEGIAVTVKVMAKMVVGQASLKNLSGPINIAQFAGESARLGLEPFLKFLALVSISLGILNLLPVPVLDGGHLLYYAIEGIRGRPLSERAQQLGQQVGLALLLMLTAVAFYNDLARIFG